MSIFFFFNDTATTEIYTLSLHDALPISARLQLYLSKQRRPYVAVRRPKSESCELRRFLPLPSNSGRKVILDRESNCGQPTRVGVLPDPGDSSPVVADGPLLCARPIELCCRAVVAPPLPLGSPDPRRATEGADAVCDAQRHRGSQ